MSKEQDSAFFRNFSVLVGILAVMLIGFAVIAQYVGSNPETEIKQRSAEVARITAPVGQSEVQSQAENVEALAEVATEVNGETIYKGMCAACHGIPGIGAPIVGNTEDWKPRIAKGVDVLYENAINGVVGASGAMMPARGGGNFSDEEVKAAVDYMLSRNQ